MFKKTTRNRYVHIHTYNFFFFPWSRKSLSDIFYINLSSVKIHAIAFGYNNYYLPQETTHCQNFFIFFASSLKLYSCCLIAIIKMVNSSDTFRSATSTFQSPLSKFYKMIHVCTRILTLRNSTYITLNRKRRLSLYYAFIFRLIFPH